MNMTSTYLLILSLLMSCWMFPVELFAQSKGEAFSWPEGKGMALSLTFDDARPSQVQGGTALLDQYGAKATFYVLPGPVAEHLAGWKAAVEQGHEIGNHSQKHPCSGNFLWARPNALEGYSLEKMEQELLVANRQLEELLGVEPVSFAYPCGHTFIGRGKTTQSYVPLIATAFESGRGWMDEAPNDPAYCDMAQLTGVEMDGKDFDDLKALLEQTKAQGGWLVLGGHEMAEEGNQTTRLSMLKELILYAQKPENGIWLGTVGEIGSYIIQNRVDPD